MTTNGIGKWGRRADDEEESNGATPPGRRRPPTKGRSEPPSSGGGSGDGGSDPEGEDPFEEEPVVFADLPKAVREAVVEQCPGAGHFDALRITDGEAVCYNVLARRGRVEMSVTVSPAGEVMEFDVDVAPSRLPKPVREMLARDYDGVDFARVGAVTMHFFELHYHDGDGGGRTLQVDASGKVLDDVEDGAPVEGEEDDEAAEDGGTRYH